MPLPLGWLSSAHVLPVTTNDETTGREGVAAEGRISNTLVYDTGPQQLTIQPSEMLPNFSVA